MTVSTTLDRQYFPGDGSNVNFPFNFKFLDDADIYVWLISASGVATQQVLTTDYTLTGEMNENGGQVTMLVAPPMTTRLLIQRVVPEVQPTSIRNQGKFFAEVHENVFDRLTMLVQQAIAATANSLKLDISGFSWNFLGHRGVNAADPIDGQDVTTKNWVSSFVASVSGAINTTIGIAYDTGTLFDYLRFGVERNVDSIAALRLLAGTRNQRAFVRGYYAKGDGGGGHYHIDQADVVSADNGGSIIVAADGARWKLQHNGTFRPEQFGARANGTDDWAFLTALISYIRVLGGGVMDLGGGGKSFQTSKPIRLYANMRITGYGYIIAMPGFSSTVVFPTYGTLVPQTYNTILYFNDGTKADDPTNFGYRGLVIDDTVEIYGNYNCDCGLIMEGITNYRISGRFQLFNSVGVYAKYYCWGGRINAHISSCAVVPLKLGEAANGIDLNGLQVFGNANDPTYCIQIVGDNNGINLSGAFVEKCINGILWTGGSGPGSISGVDFEDCFGDLITIDGTGVVGRAAGPITISGSFLEATNVAVKCINAVAIVTGCRIRSTPLAFSTSGDRARIYDIANEFEGVVTRSIGGNVISDINNSISRKQINFLPNGLSAMTEVQSLENNTYSYNVNAAVNLLSFSTQLVDIPTKKMYSQSIWETREMRNGSVFAVAGIKIDNSAAGAKQVVPRGDNDHSFGIAALRWSIVYCATGTINTSDRDSKQDIRDISEAEKRVAIAVRGLIKAYRLKDSVAAKGDGARIHIGVIAQDVQAAFEAEGLDGFRYGVLCYDEWDEKEQSVDEHGTVIDSGFAAGKRYGVRYDELSMFFMSTFA